MNAIMQPSLREQAFRGLLPFSAYAHAIDALALHCRLRLVCRLDRHPGRTAIRAQKTETLREPSMTSSGAINRITGRSAFLAS